jgi:hypothetical protein
VRRALARAAIAILALAAVAAGGLACRVGPEATGKGAELTVTRDFGAHVLLQASEQEIPGGETVMRFLQRKAKVETRYGGRFVNAIDGVRSRGGAPRSDWFYYVNGIEEDQGAAEKRLHTGDRVWWDYHDWSAVMRVPAVVGSFPEPFRNGADGKRFPVRIDCAQDADAQCREVAERLDKAGAVASLSSIGATTGKELLRLVVGRWADARRDSAARLLEQGPKRSGVFARIGPGAAGIDLLDSETQPVRTLGEGAGIVAATRFEDQAPTWVVTGIDDRGLRRAVALLAEPTLRDRFAVASDGAQAIPLPVRQGQEAQR